MGDDRQPGIPLVRHVSVSGLALFGFADMGTHIYLTGYVFPWRSALLLALTVPPAAAAAAPEWLLLALSVLGTGCLALEVFHRRIFLTPTHLVRQSGILGRNRTQLPLVDVEEVSVTYPGRGEHLGFGDVHIRATASGTTLVAVKRPIEVAQAILDAHQRLVEGAASSSRRPTKR